jgi:predicted lipid-binding transport protein (Tim44 family)
MRPSRVEALLRVQPRNETETKEMRMMAAIIVGILVGLGGLLMGGLAMAVSAVLSRVLGLYRSVAEMTSKATSKAKTVMIGSASAGTRPVRHAEIERPPEGRRRVDERRLAA